MNIFAYNVIDFTAKHLSMAKLKTDDILDLLNNISIEQAYDSDIGGDSDADDNTIFEKIKYIPGSTPETSSMSNPLVCEKTVRRTRISIPNDFIKSPMESPNSFESEMSTVSSTSLFSNEASLSYIQIPEPSRLRPKRPRI